MSSGLALSYVLPLKAGAPATDLDAYLRSLAGAVELVVVDGSPDEVFADNARRWRPLDVAHVPVDPDLVTPMGKVGGVLTGVHRASHDVVVIADDDVRWTVEQLREAAGRMAGGAAVLRPQNRFDPLPWHARWDTGRILLARITGGDWPGTLVIDRDALIRAGGYDGSVLFENLELVRTLEAAGGRSELALDLLVTRLPPTAQHFWSQRVRQAYDEWARPGRFVVELSILPLVAVGRARALVGLTALAIGVAELGRRQAGGRAVFAPTAALWAPLWVAERAVTSWIALGSRLVGGARYGSGRLPRAANRPATLRRSARARDRADDRRAATNVLQPTGSAPAR
jgi:hypothetical protein